MIIEEKLLKLRKLADAMYYAAQQLTTDASRLHKAMDEYHEFIIHECKEEPVSEDLEEVCEQFAENVRKHKAETISPFFSPTDYKQGVIDGANWQKQKMMKNAVSGHIGQTVNGILRVLSDEVDDELGFEAGDKVKLIIIKKD